jgi:hypothetical protein
MTTVDNMSMFSFSCMCDLVEFYGIAVILLAALMKRCGCGGMRAVVFHASSFYKYGSKLKCLLNTRFIFASFVYLTYRKKNFCY